jgi:glycosyltransferase 2 family protein
LTSCVTQVARPDARPSRLKRALGYGFALACLVWVFHDIQLRPLLANITVHYWRFVAMAVTFDIVTYLLQGMRWSLLLASVGRLSSMRATRAIYAGLFVNELVPLRFGEVVRAFLVSRWLSLQFVSVLPSMIVERFLDGLWLAAGIALAATFVPLPRQLIKAGAALGGIVVLATFLFLWAALRKAKNLEPKKGRDASGVARFASQCMRGLRDVGASHRMYPAALLSAGMLGCQILALWFIMLACQIGLPLWSSAVALLILRLGTTMPNAPANVGSFQFFSVLALRLFGVEKTVAVGVSIVYFISLTIPLWILGLLAIAGTGLSLATMRWRLLPSRGFSRLLT